MMKQICPSHVSRAEVNFTKNKKVALNGNNDENIRQKLVKQLIIKQ
jgi:hypothetical protein